MKNNIIAPMLISFLVGILLMLMPLPHLINWLRPQWIFLILLFWVVREPDFCGIGTAWMLGLFTDCLMGTPLGLHALVYAFLIYIVLKFHAPFSNLPRWQQMLTILFFSSLNLLLQKMILNFSGNGALQIHFFTPVLLSTLFWPLIYSVLNRFNPRRLIY